MKTKGKTLEEKLAFAVGHEVRMEALTIFSEGVSSPKEVAAELGITLKTASHHIGILRDEGCIELVRIEPRGGSAEHFYRAEKRSKLSDEEWEATPEPRRRRIIAAVFRNLTAEVLSSLRAGRLTTDNQAQVRMSWKPTHLDAQGRQEAADEQREHLERLDKIEARAAKRMTHTGESGVSIIIAVLGFRRSRNVRGKLAPGDA